MKTRTWWGVVTGILVVFIGLPFAATAQLIVLSDLNSDLGVHLTPGGDTMDYWNVDGVSHLYSMEYFYRIGPAGPEISLDQIGPMVGYVAGDSNPFTDPSDDFVTVLYTSAVADVEMKVSLQGGPVGSQHSDVTHQLKITNTGIGPLDFHLFQYLDFDIMGTFADDYVELFTDSNTGLPDESLQTDGNWTVSEVVTPDASHGQVGYFNQLISLMEDANPTTLNDDLGPLTNGNFEYALQWDIVIPEGGTFILSKDILITPEPGTLVMGLVGLLGLGLARRRR